MPWFPYSRRAVASPNALTITDLGGAVEDRKANRASWRYGPVRAGLPPSDQRLTIA